MIGKVIKYGALFAIANQVIKTIHSNDTNAEQQQQPQSHQPAIIQHQDTWRDASGYVHQPYCNGQCSGHCNGPSPSERCFADDEA
ncbi:hypothetical protein BAUCODRAFT_35238 [Baudoinia panamericana UAMH 10762]|uniref:Uncharacterized protein n=1 Tax=Baudoinia panamericana (strain UAMH 10762) TaxID=717646 RepID=M2LLR7_BAUPA|nr:uncharacterized protein BAUCODRAFT_35238 [Baudoinia panamericana UAMH 10762]EMC95247.1 hypothetical protein BAUCODRAFT_35238 [Baudoinia panamericana UAMH 10762]